jgi:glycosyltransferase involved in cell wall biosynthesis
MRLVAVTRILNESDIVEAFVRHTAALVDYHVLLDNGSTDATLDILASLRAEGLGLEVHQSSAVVFAESVQNNFLFRQAAGVCGADWVLPLDADEFVDVRGLPGALRAALQGEASDAVKVRVREYVSSPGDDAAELLVPVRITHARALTDNMKVIARGGLLARDADLQPGGHGIRAGGDDVPWEVLEGVVYAHYAVRSPWQWITKFTIGWSKVLAAGPTTTARGYSDHYREPFRVLKTAPADILLNPYFMQFCHNEAGLMVDPLPYHGIPLRYTRPVDQAMRAVQALMAHLETLSLRHGERVEAEACRQIAATCVGNAGSEEG